jgi:hypothetical protein
MAPSAPLILPTEVFADLRDPGSVRTPDPWPVVGAHINLAADTDRTGIRLTLDNVVSDADHVLATHRHLLLVCSKQNNTNLFDEAERWK